MLAVGHEMDVTQQHHLVISGDLLKGPLQEFVRILVIAGKPFPIGSGDTHRGLN
jgi:hypothetical protein